MEYWLLSKEMETVTRLQILDVDVYIPHIGNTFGKGIILVILSRTMDK